MPGQELTAFNRRDFKSVLGIPRMQQMYYKVGVSVIVRVRVCVWFKGKNPINNSLTWCLICQLMSCVLLLHARPGLICKVLSDRQ